jgi:asparagine synthase (glutamine-hydrolysing)
MATDGQELAHVLVRMTDTLRHRGPDDAGQWVDASAGIALGHRRLAIVDPSKAGHQPMCSASGRYVLSYNGELYNAAQLRGELERAGARFAGHCDTEVLLAGIELWGVERMLERGNGMWAFALWDRRERALTLVRDRMGEKPLYYARVARRGGTHVVFASELRALRRHPQLREQVDRVALAAHLRYGYVPAPRTILAGVAKLGPGELLRIDADTYMDARPVQWWTLAQAAAGARAGGEVRTSRMGENLAPARGNAATENAYEAQAQLHELLRDAVRLRMSADVPLGALLSGGVDSSTLVALMQEASGGRVRTFSVGFDDPALDEARHAAAVARHLGSEHTELRVSGADALATVDELASVCDEPFADAAILPTLLIARLARRHVTVAFAGDGGDELFYGYPRYRWAERLRRAMRDVPSGVRRTAAAAALRLPLGDRPLKVLELARADPEDYYERLVACWPRTPVLGLSADAAINPVFATAAQLLAGERTDAQTLAGERAAAMALADGLSYLPEDILVKVDRASMAASLEARVPLLDHRVVQLAWQLPAPDVCAPDGLHKQPLREILYRYVPRELVDRPKRGFETPLADWLRGPLRPWAQELLDPARLAADGLLDVPAIMRHWHEHIGGQRNWHRRLWPVLTFQAWLSSTNHHA